MAASPELRATDDNRTAVVTALDSALDSGQLDRFEHLQRVRAATAARLVSELRPLLADLQGEHVPLPGDRKAPWRASTSSSSRFTPQHTHTVDPDHFDIPAGRIATVVVGLLVLAGIVATIALSVGSGSSDAPAAPAANSNAEEQAPQADAGPGAEPLVLDNPPAHSPDGLSRIFSTAATASGSDVASRITVHPEHATLYWPDPEHPSQTFTLNYRGGWSDRDDRATSDDATFPLAELDAELVARLIAGAPDTLGIDGGTTSHIIIEPDDAGQPRYSIYAGNTVHQSGYFVVDHAGTVLRIHGP